MTKSKRFGTRSLRTGASEGYPYSWQIWSKTLVFAVLAPVIIVICIPYWLLFQGGKIASGKYQLLGALPIAIGVSVYSWGLLDFAIGGHGTPVTVDPPEVLTTGGLYRVVRNPMYLAVLLILFGESMLFASRIVFCYALFVWSFFHLYVVLYEEPLLKERFSMAFEKYRKTVRRWLPRIPRAQ